MWGSKNLETIIESSSPVVRNLPFNVGDTGSIPGQGAKIPRAVGQLGPRVATREPMHHK